ncbi:MAG: hypothetical protein HFJ30_10365 [Clostridia bacterium]|jgi:hypothetical protein|nr:hypothetical protein [Clostridia bacterium]
MIIVSQDKTEIINFDKLAEIVVCDTVITITDGIQQERGLEIGKYKTEQRAKEVLQEIIKYYKDTNYEYENCWCLRNLVYEMPAE